MTSVLACLSPESCTLCGRRDDLFPLPPAGRRAGLRAWDRPSVCRGCFRKLERTPPLSRTLVCGDDSLLLAGGTTTHNELAIMVGRLKYHGIRGVAIPLGQLVGRGVEHMLAEGREVDAFVPIPLHRRRRRERGFNQARLLAEVAGDLTGLPLLTDILFRRKRTRQQARIASARFADRLANVSGGFRVRPCGGGGPRLGLIDDLVTTGATAMAAALALRAGGWDVAWVAGAGLAPE